MTTDQVSQLPSTTRLVGDREVGAIGLGSAEMAIFDIGPESATATIHAALDAGVRLLDGAAAYTPDLARAGHSERLLSTAVATWDGPQDEVVIATKGGHRRVTDGMTLEAFGFDGSPQALRRDAEGSLAALDRDTIDLYFLHWPDPDVPITESMGALEELRDEGRIRLVGLSNVSVEQLDAASTVGRIDAVQNRFSPLAQGSRPVLDWCERNRAAFVAYSPLGGLAKAGSLAEQLPAFAELAGQLDVSVHRVVLAWMLGLSDRLLPIVGCRRVESATDSAAAAELRLTDEQRAGLDRAVEAATQEDG